MMVFDGGLCDWFVHYHPQYDAWNQSSSNVLMMSKSNWRQASFYSQCDILLKLIFSVTTKAKAKGNRC